MAGKIFVNYRRDDSAPHALSIAQYLERKFSARNVFIDIDRMRAGQNFPTVLEDRLKKCDVMLAVIGPKWLDLRDENGGRRLDNPEDWVRMEIERALARGITVIPITVGGANLPSKSELPEPLRALADHHAANITTNGFRNEMAGLTLDIKSARKTGSPVRTAAASLALLGIVLAFGTYAYNKGMLAWPTSQERVADTPSSPSPRSSRGEGRGEGQPTATESAASRVEGQPQSSEPASAPHPSPLPANGEREQPNPNVAMIKEAQTLLKELGYDPGEPDGKRGVKTSDAIKDFQRNMGTSSRKIFGQVDNRLLGALRLAKRTRTLEQRRAAREAEAKKAADEAAAKKKAEEAEKQRVAMLKAEEERKAVEAPAANRLPFEPEMVAIPGGTFQMGCVSGKNCITIKSAHSVTIKPFEIGKFEVTFNEWNACVADGACKDKLEERWSQIYRPGRRPFDDASWKEITTEYLPWLNRRTGKAYRLPSEAEWEYAARAGAITEYFWGDEIGQNNANCKDCGSGWDNIEPSPVGSFKPNALGLHDVHGNVWELVEDCWHDNYTNAPKGGAPWLETHNGECKKRVLRGGAWDHELATLQFSFRFRGFSDSTYSTYGFRVARDVD